MEKRARKFLDIAERYYERNKVKWVSLLQSIGLSFDEDIYNDTILNVYDKISSNIEFDEKTDDEIIGYWYKAYLNNLKRDRRYAVRSKRSDNDVMDILKDEEYIVESPHLYFATIRVLLDKVRENYDPHSYHIFKMYYLVPEMTFEELSCLVGYDVKPKISRIRKWLANVVHRDNDGDLQ